MRKRRSKKVGGKQMKFQEREGGDGKQLIQGDLKAREREGEDRRDLEE